MQACLRVRNVDNSRDTPLTLKSRQLFTRIPHTWCTQKIIMRMRCSCWGSWTFANPTVNQSKVQDRRSQANALAWSERVKHEACTWVSLVMSDVRKCVSQNVNFSWTQKSGTWRALRASQSRSDCLLLNVLPFNPEYIPCGLKYKMNAKIKCKQTQTDGSMHMCANQCLEYPCG